MYSPGGDVKAESVGNRPDREENLEDQEVGAGRPESRQLLCLLLLVCFVCALEDARTQDNPGEWRHWGGDAGEQRYGQLRGQSTLSPFAHALS